MAIGGGGLSKGGGRKTKGSSPRWTFFSVILCAISFLVGRNSSSSPSALNLHSGCPKEEAIDSLHSKIAELQAASHDKIAELQACTKAGNDAHRVPPPRPVVTARDETTNPAKDGVIFDEAWISDPNLVMRTINNMCNLVMDNIAGKSRDIGIGTIVFCYTHVLTYKRDYDYTWDSIDANRTDYYTGTELPPYQMDILQYASIISTIVSIPSRPILEELESRGKEFRDEGWKNYVIKPRTKAGPMGPRVLFWGCGSDTPLHAHVIEFLDGNITFIDNSEEFAKVCEQWHPDVRFVAPAGNGTYHADLVKNAVPPDGSGLETDDVVDRLTASQWMTNLDGVESELPWDVIVVDGPAMDRGRSQPLYVAKRLAQSYGPNHYTHIFLHDASRSTNCDIANAIMGHDPSVYIGNTLPRKGLKHWRVPGRERKLPPTKPRQGSADQ